MHDGTQTASDDQLVLSVSDGKHTVSKSIHITIIPSLRSLKHHAFAHRVTIRVDEGREVTIRSRDLQDPSKIDSADENLSLIYEVVRPPQLGEFRVHGRASDRFDGSDLAAGSVAYRHTGGEIGRESATDSAVVMIVGEQGQRRSSNYTLVEVSFVVSPDDNVPPQLMLGLPLVVEQGKAAPLTSAVITARDLDSSENALTFVVFRKPVWGLLVKTSFARSKRQSPGHSVSSFTMTELREGAIQYVQQQSHAPDDGQPPQSDSFFVFATDGKQNSSLGKVEVAFARNSNGAPPPTTTMLTFQEVNSANSHARPRIVRNEAIRVRFGSTKIIDNEYLSAVDDADTQIQFTLVSHPRKGVLELEHVNSTSRTWKKLGTGMNFTQEDIDSNRLRYTHTKSLDHHPWKDGFVFELSDGMNRVSQETFEIEIVKMHSETRVIHNNGMTVDAGTSAVITSDELSIIDSDTNSQDIQYFVTGSPSAGVVEIDRRGNHRVPITSFSQADLDRSVIFYNHFLNSSATNDSFEFSVRGRRNEPMLSGFFQIRINQTMSVSPVVEVNVPLMVTQGSRAPITKLNLKMSSHEVTAPNLVYTVFKPPRYGKLLINDTIVYNFTQSDVDGANVFYKSESSDEMMDYFLFSISSRSETETQTKAELKPQFFNILIQPMSRIAPTVRTVRPLTTLVPLSDDRQGFVLTDAHLQSTHALFAASDLVYNIREKSSSGYFENRGTKRVVRKRFTQKDVADGLIVFIINNDVQVTNDSVILKVTDPNRNAVDNVRYV